MAVLTMTGSSTWARAMAQPTCGFKYCGKRLTLGRPAARRKAGGVTRLLLIGVTPEACLYDVVDNLSSDAARSTTTCLVRVLWVILNASRPGKAAAGVTFRIPYQLRYP